MGRIYEALQRSSAGKSGPESPVPDLGISTGVLESVGSDASSDLDRVPLLALTSTPEQRLVTLNGHRSLGAEKLRILAARLRHLQDQRSIKRLLITSSVKDEGKTVVSSNVAISLARSRQRVLLIDGDCHLAKTTSLFGAGSLPGITDWWRSNGRILDYLKRVNSLPLWILPAGQPVEQPVEMLQSERVSQLLVELGNWFDWVIIDSPPSAPLADAAVWEKMSDAVILVTREGRTPKALLRKVVDSLDPTKLLGVVLNDCSDRNQQYYSHYYKTPPDRR